MTSVGDESGDASTTPLRIFVSTISANYDVSDRFIFDCNKHKNADCRSESRTQRILMLLNGNGIRFEQVDISASEKERAFMREHAMPPYEGAPTLPPQIFYLNEWLGVSVAV